MIQVKIRECQIKRCFFEKKDGSGKGVIIHKSVILSEDSVIRFDKKNGRWKFSSVRFNSKVSSSLQLRSMSVAEENGRDEKVEERFMNFEKFAERMVGIVGVEEFMKIVSFLK